MITLPRSKYVSLCAAMALSAITAVGSTALAADTLDSPRSVTVKFGDLDASSPAGVAALYRRIHNAAKSVCDDGDRALGTRVRVERCSAEAESRAVKQVNNAALSAYYRMKQGRAEYLLAHK